MEEKKNVRVILNVPSDLNDKYTELAKKRGISKSAMIMYSMSWFLDYNNTIDVMPQLLSIYNTMAKEDIQKIQSKDKSE